VFGEISTKSSENDFGIFSASSIETIFASTFSPTILTKAAVISLFVLCCFSTTTLPLYLFFNAMFFSLIIKFY